MMFRRARHGLALALLQLALGGCSSDQIQAEKRVEALLKAQDYKTALEVAEEFVRKSPEKPAGRALKTRVLALSGQTRAAIEEYQRHTRLAGDDSGPLMRAILEGAIKGRDIRWWSRPYLNFTTALVRYRANEYVPAFRDALQEALRTTKHTEWKGTNFENTDWRTNRLIAALGELQDREALPILQDAFRHRHLRGVVVSFLPRLEDKRAVPLLKQALDDNSESIRYEAGISLAVLGEPDGVTAIEYLLKDATTEDFTRVRAVWSLRKAQAGNALRAIMDALSDSNSDVQLTAAEVLSERGDSEAVDLLRRTLSLDQLGPRMRAAGILARQGDADARSILLRTVLRDPAKESRLTALLYVRALGEKSAGETYRALLKDSENEVRFRAALALAEMKDRAAISPLYEALNDEEETVRINAAISLGALGDKGALPRLQRLLSDPATNVPLAALVALWKLER